MLAYVAKRLLLIPPTFFLVSLVIFAVLNLAPGQPGRVTDGAESANQGDQRESYRLFKEQFHLDKPVLFNTRFLLSIEDTRRLIDEAKDPSAVAAVRIRAQEKLEDYGAVLVRHLIALLSEPAYALDAVRLLPRAAAGRVSRDASGSEQERNRRLASRNERLKAMSYDEGARESVRAQVHGQWREFFEANREEFEWGAARAVHDFFLDTRFARYWGNLIRFDFGLSLIDRRPVRDAIGGRLRYSLSLTLVSIVLAYLIAVPLGVFSAARQGTTGDTVITVILFLLYSLPTFFTGTVLLRLLASGDPLFLFPPGGFESMDAQDLTTVDRFFDILWHLVLPVLTYTSVTLAALSRYARAGVIDVIRADYVRTARAKGLHEAVVVVKHAARNGMIPIL
ncbi:MAG: ABC transporter permease, partial [Myxococcota bacterium]